MTQPVEPSRYSAIETLRDGRSIEIRAQTSADVAELRAAVGRMSDESIYRRFFQPERHFSECEVAFYLNAAFVTHAALVAVLSEGRRSRISEGHATSSSGRAPPSSRSRSRTHSKGAGSAHCC